MVGRSGRRLKLRRIVAIAWLVLATALLWMPPPPQPRTDLPWLDEAVHLLLFAGIAWLWRWAGVRLATVVAFGVAWGGLTELGQGMLPWERTPDVFDFAADATGVLLGVALAAIGPTNVERPRPRGSGAPLRNGRDSNPR